MINVTGWVLMCLSLCNPEGLRKTWNTKQECRNAVINILNSRLPKDRFPWRCVKGLSKPVGLPYTAEELERE